jgi:signal peptidase I
MKININIKKIIKEWGPYVFIILLVFLFKEFLYAPILVQGSSMESNLLENDVMILDKVTYKTRDIKRNDIVVISYNNKYLVKRVIALPGETFEVKNNLVFINGQVINEEYLDDDAYTKNYKLLWKVPEDCYFVMGDNRLVSYDSRSLGCFSREKILGKTNLVIFPFDRIGTKK